MTCRDFHRKWNELLDAESGVVTDPETAGSAPIGVARTPAVDEAEALLLVHATACPVCRPIAARYQVLRQAIRAWRQAPVPSADLAQRILSAPAETTLRPWRFIAADRTRTSWRDPRGRQRIVLAGLAATAMLGLALEWAFRPERHVRPDLVRDVVVPDLHSHELPPKAPETSLALNRALAEATSATWDLARSASEPAARISRDVLDASPPAGESPAQPPVHPSAAASSDTNGGLVDLSLPVPSLDPLGSDATAASTVIQEVGDRLSAGVAPISDTARHAFGFLLGPPGRRAESRESPSSPAGARNG